MSNSARGIKFWLKAWLPVVVAILLVAIESTAYFGSDQTSGPLRHIWERLFGPVANHHWYYIHVAVRKSGHFAGFGLVGLTWLRAWRMTIPRAPFLHLEFWALAGTALIAAADEFHQSFLPNRSSSPRDVLLDCIGAVMMMCVVQLFLKLKGPQKLARAA